MSLIDYTQLGKRIKQHRLEKGYTQANLAELAELGDNYISQIETGRTKLALPSLVKIAVALETSLDILLQDSFDFTDIQDIEIQNLLKSVDDDNKKLIRNLIIAVIQTKFD